MTKHDVNERGRETGFCVFQHPFFPPVILFLQLNRSHVLYFAIVNIVTMRVSLAALDKHENTKRNGDTT